MDRLPQVNFALDIDNTAAARIHRGGNPRRHTKGRVADFQHRQAVALAHGRAIGIDQDDPRQHVIQDTRRDSSGTGCLGLERTLDMTRIGHFIARQVTDEVRFADQLEQIANTRRQTSLVLGQTRAVGRQPRHRTGGQRCHAFFRSACSEQLGKLLKALINHRDIFVEVHQNPEHFLEVRIQVLQRVIQLAGTDDDDLDLQGDDLRVERHGGQAPHFAQRRLHLQLARLQGTLESIPDKRLAEHFLGFKNQKAAIGTVQGARTQLPISGVERALVGAVFDTAKQVVVGRVRLEHYRRTAA